jgi:hypothetical protein
MISANASSTLTPPAQYALVPNSLQTSTTITTGVYYHIWHVGDPTSGLIFQSSASVNLSYICTAYSGVNQANPYDGANSQHNSASNVATSPAVNGNTNDVLLMLYGVLGSPHTFTTASEGTIEDSLAGGPSGAWIDSRLTTDGSTGDQAVTFSGNVNSSNGFQIALLPAGPLTPPPTPTPPTPTPPTPAPTPTATATTAINGVYDLARFNTTIPSAIKTNTDIDGVSLRVTAWSTVEPTEGLFDWSKIDSMIAQVSTPNPTKKITITIPAGYTTPQWVYDAGAASYSWVWDRNWGPPICSIARMPLPWDPVFQSKWAALVAAFGARYSKNPQIVSVKLTGPGNAPDAELWLPHKGVAGIGHGSITCNGTGGFQCCSYNADQAWIEAGYTRAKMVGAMEWDMDRFHAAFPKTPSIIESDPCSLPAIDDNGKFFSTPGNCGDTQGVDAIDTYGMNTYGRSGFVIQNDGLEASPYAQLAAYWNTMTSDAVYVDIGFQFAWPVGTTNFSSITQTGINHGAKEIEFYESDLTNPANASAIASAHNQLLAQ